MLDDRAQLLLKTLVDRYIADGQPVGSRTLSKAAGLDLSPATIRNVMGGLEDMGLIASPHTSAGRVPPARAARGARPAPSPRRFRGAKKRQPEGCQGFTQNL